MAHRVKVLPYKTFRLHLSVCPPYNADFDGDEMNLHVPQSEEAQTEARLLMTVQDQILSPRYGGPLIGAIRDFITSAYILTKSSTRLTREEIFRLLSASEYRGPVPEPVQETPIKLWTGKQVISLFIPEGLNYVLRAGICQQCSTCKNENCPHDAFVVVKNGVLERGVIDKNSIGAEKSESLYHRIVKDYGTEVAKEFLNSISKLLTEFITMKGFTFSIDELDLSNEATRNISKIITKVEKNVNKLISNLKNGTLQRLPGKSPRESLEIYIMNELAEARDKAGTTADEDLSGDNHGTIMTRTGARGSSLNIGQMTACVGQQSVRGKRIYRGYKNRTLAHFKSGDQSPEGRGFVYNSYREGLKPIEFFFHAMGGREGLVDTAVRTQQSGYMQRRLINALEYLRAEYDETVRDSEGDIIEFKYGEDGVDPAKSDHGKAVNIKRLLEGTSIVVKKGKPASKRYVENQINKIEKEVTPVLAEELKKSILASNLNRTESKKIIQKVVEDYKNALVEPGEAVGIIAAQSIGEPGTQMTLRTFHYAGVKEMNVTLGLPRIIEIVDARNRPKTPTMTVHLDENHKKTREKATEVATRIVATELEHIISETYIEGESLVLQFDLDKMKTRGVTLFDLNKLNIKDCDINIMTDKIILYPEDSTKVKEILDDSMSYQIKGVRGITRALVTEEMGEWLISTEGSNLEVLKITGVDPTRVKTNDIHEISSLLGIEAARNALIQEAKGVLDEQGLDVDVRHIMLVADTMTQSGEIRQVGRHGVSGKKTSVLARAAFEITVPTLVKASTKGATDKFRGVTESVIVGQDIPVGTGLVELFMGSRNKTEINNP
jgi:DNA-directed RNA polymerase subunit A'